MENHKKSKKHLTLVASLREEMKMHDAELLDEINFHLNPIEEAQIQTQFVFFIIELILWIVFFINYKFLKFDPYWSRDFVFKVKEIKEKKEEKCNRWGVIFFLNLFS